MFLGDALMSTFPDIREFPDGWKHLECPFVYIPGGGRSVRIPGGALMSAFPDSLEFPDGWKHLERSFVYIPGGGHWVHFSGRYFDVYIPRQSGISRRVETSGKPICLHSGWRSLGALFRVVL